MGKNEGFEKIIEKTRESDEYKTEKLSMAFMVQIWKLMYTANISQSDLARKTGLKESYLSRILNRSGNLTIATLAKIIDALNGEIAVSIKEKAVKQDENKSFENFLNRRVVLTNHILPRAFNFANSEDSDIWNFKNGLKDERISA